MFAAFSFPAFIEERFGVETALVKEISLSPLQELTVGRKIIRPFIEETIGKTARDSVIGSFYSLRPGVRILPPSAGSAELSYTFSQVDFDGDLIYPMVKEFQRGVNHRISLILSINAGKHLFFTGFLRSDKSEHEKWKTMASIEALLKI